MSGSRQRDWLRGILEGAPSILFLVLSQNHFDIRVAGWAGAALAALVLIGFSVLRVPQNQVPKVCMASGGAVIIPAIEPTPNSATLKPSSANACLHLGP